MVRNRSGHRNDPCEPPAQLENEHVTAYCPKNMQPKSVAAGGIPLDQNGSARKCRQIGGKIDKKMTIKWSKNMNLER